MLTTYSSFLSRIDELGFMTLSPVLTGLPSLSAETLESQWHTGDPETDPWRWKDRAAEDKAAAYGCILNGHKGFVSARMYALFYSACRPGETMEERWANGHVKPVTWELYRLFQDSSQLDTSAIRREMRVRARSGAGKVDAAVQELQSQFYVTGAGSRRKIAKNGQPYGWAAQVYERVETWAPEAWLQGVSRLDPIVSCETILDVGVQIGQNVERVALARVLGFLPAK
jgi:hypothetical protein